MTTGTTPRRLQWATHADLAIDRRPTVDREDLPMDWVEAARAHRGHSEWHTTGEL